RSVEVGVDVLHLAGNLRADLHRAHGVQRTACRHHGCDRPALDLRYAVADFAAFGAPLVPVPAAAGCGCRDDERKDGGEFHGGAMTRLSLTLRTFGWFTPCAVTMRLERKTPAATSRNRSPAAPSATGPPPAHPHRFP